MSSVEEEYEFIDLGVETYLRVEFVDEENSDACYEMYQPVSSLTDARVDHMQERNPLSEVRDPFAYQEDDTFEY